MTTRRLVGLVRRASVPTVGVRKLLRSALGAAEPLRPSHVVVIADTRPDQAAQAVAGSFPGAHVHVLDASSDGAPTSRPASARGTWHEVRDHEEMFRAVCSLPPADLVLDVRSDPDAQKYWAFRRLFLGLPAGGRYVVLGISAEDPAADPTPPPSRVDPYRRPLPETPPAPGLDAWLDRLLDARGWDRRLRMTRLSPFERQVAAALGEVVRGDGWRVVVKTGAHHVLLGTETVGRALDGRGVRARELDRRAGRRIEAQHPVGSNDEAFTDERLPRTEDVPDLVCTVYDDVLCAPGQVASVAGVLLPASYVQPWRRPSGQLRVNTAASEYGPEPSPGDEHLTGTYFHLDNEVAGHYGHFLTHDLTRLWAWERVVAEYPDVRLLMGGAGRPPTVPPFALEMLEAFGIARDRVTVLTGPTRVERLVTATQAFQQPLFLAPEAAGPWGRVRDALLARTELSAVPDKVFVARTDDGRRRCRNGEEVEARFLRAGYERVYPEQLPLPEQVAIFARSSVVAGYAGSGMINAVWSEADATRIVFASRSYPAINEYHLARHFGSRLHYFWCEPDVPVPSGGMTKKAFHSDFRFDTEADGPALDELIASL